MEKRILGNNDLGVSAIGLGCMGMSGGYRAMNDREAIKVLIEFPGAA